MKVTKLQTALIVAGVGVAVSLLMIIIMIKTHPILTVLLVACALTVGIGYIMYKKNGGK